MEVFVVQHTHLLGDTREDIKLIGVYSTVELAQEAVKRMRERSGFCDAPDGFSIDRYPIDVDRWTEGYIAVHPDNI